LHPEGRLGLSVPLRWRPAHGCGRSKTLNVIACRVQVHVRFEYVSKRGAPMQARDQAFESRCKAALCVHSPRFQREKCSLSSSSRLTLPSRGRSPAYGLQAPLMSNVMALSLLRVTLHSLFAASEGSVLPARSWSRCSRRFGDVRAKVASVGLAKSSLALRRSAEPGVAGRFWRQLRSRRHGGTGAGARGRTQYELKIAALAGRSPT
jgi:hypothetical protein